jgi:hypothetical protein
VRFRILLSYHYYRDTDLDALFAKSFTRPYPEVFADSGAYSSFTQGITIDVRAYADWVKRWRHLFAVYANLDAIGNAEQTRVNQQRLEDLGLTPLPVFHTGDSWEYLDWYLERYQYIALGGMVPYARTPKKLMPWLVQCFKRAQGHAVYHGFGCTGWSLMRSFPWYTVDSSSWGAGFRFGLVPFFCEKKKRIIDLRLGTKDAYCYSSVIHKLGFDPGEFADRSRNQRDRICAFSALSYLRAEAWLRKTFGVVHHAQGDGVKMYLADSTADAKDTGIAHTILSQQGFL